MADGVPITAGSGTTIATDDAGASGHVQIVKLALSADGSASPVTADANGLEVQGPGTAGSAAGGVMSVQGVASMVALLTTPGGDVAHDSADSGNPIKIGARAVNALPTAVANNDRANLLADLFGRLLVAKIDPAQQIWKSANYTTTQTGVAIWDPTSGKRIAITHIVVGSYGTTAGRLILWFGANADSTYNAGTDQLVFAASYAPSSTAKPGTVIALDTPIFCTTADHELKITTDAALSVDIAVYGYEW